MTTHAPLVIYECTDCGAVGSASIMHTDTGCSTNAFRPVRVFREEDVRPLWQAAEYGTGDTAYGAADAFPAPEEWKT